MGKLANFFLGLGVGIGVVGAIGLATGFRPSQLPAGLLDLSVYKLTFVAAACVMAAGAFMRRADRARGKPEGRTARPIPELPSATPSFDEHSSLRERHGHKRPRD